MLWGSQMPFKRGVKTAGEATVSSTLAALLLLVTDTLHFCEAN